MANELVWCWWIVQQLLEMRRMKCYSSSRLDIHQQIVIMVIVFTESCYCYVVSDGCIY